MNKISFVCGLLIASGSLFAQQYTVSTIAGVGASPGWSGDGGAATSAQMSTPIRALVDGAGNVYVTDLGNSSIRFVSASTGVMNSITGAGLPGFSGDGGGAIGAHLSSPHDIALDAAGNLYIADTGNARIRIVSKGNINTFAGSTRGTVGGNLGNGGQATSAQFVIPTGVAVDNSGNVYIADMGNASVRKVAPNGTITAFAGTGFPSFGAFSGEGGPATKALLSQPYSLTTDNAGNVYIVDIGLSRLFRVGTDGNIHTVVFNFASQNCAVDAAGNIYAPDPLNHVVTKFLPTGTSLWIGGDGLSGYTGDGGRGTSAQMAQPYGAGVDGSGNVYVAEAANAVVRKLVPVPNSIGAISNSATIRPFAAPIAGAGDATIPLSPGELVTIFGTGLGPANLVVNQPTSKGYGTSLAGTSVTFAGTAAPIIYTSSTLVSVVVPYEVSGLTSANVAVTYQGQTISVIAPIAPTAPGLFTLDSSGSGQALAVKLDGTVNTSSNPVRAGDYLILYATGEGITTPASVDGSLEPLTAPFTMPVQTVSATVGGQSAVVSYAGGAPGFVEGVMQVNLQVPVGVAGSNVLQLAINGLVTPSVTIAVQ